MEHDYLYTKDDSSLISLINGYHKTCVSRYTRIPYVTKEKKKSFVYRIKNISPAFSYYTSLRDTIIQVINTINLLGDFLSEASWNLRRTINPLRSELQRDLRGLMKLVEEHGKDMDYEAEKQELMRKLNIN